MAAAYRVRVHGRQRLFCAPERRAARRGRAALRLSCRKDRAAGYARRKDRISYARGDRRGGRIHRRYRRVPGTHAHGAHNGRAAPRDAHGRLGCGASARGKGEPRRIFRRGDGSRAGRGGGVPRVSHISSPRQRHGRERRGAGLGGEYARGRLRRCGRGRGYPLVAGRGVLRCRCRGSARTRRGLLPHRKAGEGNGIACRGGNRGRIFRHRLPARGRMDARPARGARRRAGAHGVAAR